MFMSCIVTGTMVMTFQENNEGNYFIFKNFNLEMKYVKQLTFIYHCHIIVE